MACEVPLLLEIFITSVALEWFFPSVLPYVFLQSVRSSASVVALVTCERLFSCVLSHDVNFQIARFNAQILACCASVWLFFRVCLIVHLQIARLCCFVFTLIALVLFFLGVLHDMLFEVGSSVP